MTTVNHFSYRFLPVVTETLDNLSNIMLMTTIFLFDYNSLGIGSGFVRFIYIVPLISAADHISYFAYHPGQVLFFFLSVVVVEGKVK